MRTLLLFSTVLLGIGLLHNAFAADGDAPPEKYVLKYPVARQFCAPVESYWDDVSNTIQNIHGRMIRHPLGGGYGLPVVDMVGDKHLLHLGADVSWHRPVPVYAIADGVVRISTGGPTPAEMAKPVETSRKNGAKGDGIELPERFSDKPGAPAEKSKPTGPPRAPTGWGNLIVIEHKLPDGIFITSIYGHLANRRLVNAGDIVQAGQVIGTVAKSKLENGGFDPHLHFAIRDGRMFEPGCELFDVRSEGKRAAVKLIDLAETQLEVELPEGAPPNLQIGPTGSSFSVTTRDDRHYLPSVALNHLHPRGFPIIGYALTTNGFRDPTAFLEEVHADSQPATYLRFPRQTVAAKGNP